ncbi:MAG TPA: TIGR02117 family protein [Sphingomicrobium sp.]|nr:TIGR02117 family protein [Sphingomicrobium sp.]
MLKRVALVLVAVPLAYLVAALIGSLVPVNRDWTEPEEGVTIYIANNGFHSDIVMPARVQGLDWTAFVPKSDAAAADPDAKWVAFGSGEERVYLETPQWRDIRPGTVWSAIAGGKRVMHVEWVSNLDTMDRAIRLRPEEYRRLWAAVRSDFERNSEDRPERIDHPGYGRSDTFYWATGKFHALRTCNSWAASRLRLAGVRTSLWPPFSKGLTWRYRKAGEN